MPSPWWGILLGLVVFALLAVWLRRPLRTAAREARFSHARKGFHQQRERLEAKFLRLAAAQPGPDNLHWTDGDFEDSVVYVRNRRSGELLALVGVTMVLEGVGQPPASASDLLGNLRGGTAIFRFDGDHWETDGRVILNRSPSEAVRLYHNGLEVVGREAAERPV
jgi:hypothetical protein